MAFSRRVDAKGVDVYFGCATYGQANNRTQDNVVFARSFWCDLDCGPGKGYATQAAAVKAVVAFCKAVGLPTPMIVSSGKGIHIYFCTPEDITPANWTQTAELLKRATKKFKLQVDYSRSTDRASVLRCIETRNHKDPSNPLPVKLLHKGQITTHPEFHLQLTKYVGEADDLGIEGAVDPRLAGDNADLASPRREFKPSDANAIADRCAAIGAMRDTGGNIAEPHWYAAIGVLARTKQGGIICHEWSKGHPNYSRLETQTRIERSLGLSGPTTCDKMSDGFASCQSCKYRGNIKSPIELGEAAPAAVVTDQVTVQATATTPPPTSDIPDFPEHYGWGLYPGTKGKEVLWVEHWEDIEDGEGGTTPGWVKSTLLPYKLWPIARVETSAKVYSMNMYMEKERGDVTEFALDSSVVAEGGSKLFSELGSREMNLNQKDKIAIQQYLNAWVGHLRQTYAATPSITQYGWHNGGFIVGRDNLHGTGIGKAVLREAAADYAEFFEPSGDLDTWVDAVDKAYNHPGLEALQFCVLGSFAAPLWSLLMGSAGGVIVYAHSKDTGLGKTTAQKVGLSAWGNPANLVRQEGGFTINALYGHIGVMQNLPVVIDEFTNSKTDFASQLVYSVSAGQGKARMSQDAKLQKTANWSTIVLASGNNLITEKLSVHRADASAEMSRVWEFTVACKSPLDKRLAKPLFRKFDENYGHAGRAYMEYVVANKDKIRKMLAAVQDRFDVDHDITQGERYWSALHACVLTSLAICRKLGLVQFDQAAMKSWIKKQLQTNRWQISSNVPTMLDQFANMLLDLGPGILTTIGDGQNNGPIRVERPIVGPVTGRIILADPGNTAVREVIYIASDAAKKWCVKHSVAYEDMRRELVANQIVKDKTVQVCLGKGTSGYAGNRARSLEISPSAMRDVFGDTPLADKITALTSGDDNGRQQAVKR